MKTRLKYNVSDHIKSVFGMFSGEIVRATMSFDESLVNAVLDHFGKDARLTAKENGWVQVTADVSVSPVRMFQFEE